MSYPQHVFHRPYPAEKTVSITFCSCAPCRTELEQIPTQREIAVMWIKDAAAGAGLIVFVISSFLLATGAQHIFAII